jgi:hypothetical protein
VLGTAFLLQPSRDVRTAVFALLVRDENGSWYCNDNMTPDGDNPLLTVPNPRVGAYFVWFASVNPGQIPPVSLLISDGRDLAAGAGLSVEFLNELAQRNQQPQQQAASPVQ